MRVELDGGQFVGVLRVAATLSFFNGLVQCGDECACGLRVAVDLLVVAGATVKSVGENFHKFFNGARVGRFVTAAAASFGDCVSFRHFPEPFQKLISDVYICNFT